LIPDSTGIGDVWFWWIYQPSVYPGHTGPLSLAIIAWVGAVLVIDGFSHHWGRNG